MTPLEIHQIKFRLGLHPIHRWGAYDAHPDSPVDWKEVHSSSDFPLLNAFGFSISGPLVCWSSATFFHNSNTDININFRLLQKTRWPRYQNPRCPYAGWRHTAQNVQSRKNAGTAWTGSAACM